MTGFVVYALLVAVGLFGTLLLLFFRRWAWGTGIGLVTVSLASPLILIAVTGRSIQRESAEQQRASESLRRLPAPTFSVWKGAVRIGEFTEADPIVGASGSRAGSIGVLRRVPGTDSSSTRQVADGERLLEGIVRPLRLGTDGVLDSAVFIARPSIAQAGAGPGARTVAPGRELSLRDSNNAPVPTRLIQIQEMALREGMSPASWPSRFRIGDTTHRIWLVTAVFAGPQP